jgi:hypothetical protein
MAARGRAGTAARGSVAVLAFLALSAGAQACRRPGRATPDAAGRAAADSPPASGTVAEAGMTATRGAAAPDGPSGPPLPDGMVVRLVTPGRSPLRELRFSASAGARSTRRLALHMGAATTVDGASRPPVELPALGATLAVTVNDVSAGGDISYDYSLGDWEVSGEDASPAAPAIRERLAALGRIAAANVISPRGVSSSARMRMPPTDDPLVAGLLDNLGRSLRQTTLVFPEEPIGAGGKWEVTERAQVAGAEMTQTTTYEVTALEGEVLRATVRVVQSAGRQTIPAPGMPAGTLAELTGMEFEGSGTVENPLGEILPTAITLQAHGTMRMRMDVDGEPRDVVMEMRLGAEMGILQVPPPGPAQ